MKKDPCVMCGKSISVVAEGQMWQKGHNAQPIAVGQCCDACNVIVIRKRLELMIDNELTRTE